MNNDQTAGNTKNDRPSNPVDQDSGQEPNITGQNRGSRQNIGGKQQGIPLEQGTGQHSGTGQSHQDNEDDNTKHDSQRSG